MIESGAMVTIVEIPYGLVDFWAPVIKPDGPAS